MKKAILLTCAAALFCAGIGSSSAITRGAESIASAPSYTARGGEIEVSAKSRGVVELASNRFTCASCATRVTPRIKALPGVSNIVFSPFVGSSKHGSARNGLIGTLTVTFNPSKITVMEIAIAAQRSLEADPYNQNPVKLVYRTPP